MQTHTLESESTYNLSKAAVFMCIAQNQWDFSLIVIEVLCMICWEELLQ